MSQPDETFNAADPRVGPCGAIWISYIGRQDLHKLHCLQKIDCYRLLDIK